MGIISIEKSDNLLWLGRYTERVHTLLKAYFVNSDYMIENDPLQYTDFCNKIGIPNVYETRHVFVDKYPFDEGDSNSIISNLNRAYDNAIVMREYIGTETMAFIQLAIDDIKAAERGNTPMADLMFVIDHILAFWGCVDDIIDDMQIRNMIKLGKGLERVDIYLRLDKSYKEVLKEYKRMKQYLMKSGIQYDQPVLDTADAMMEDPEVNYQTLRNLLLKLI